MTRQRPPFTAFPKLAPFVALSFVFMDADLEATVLNVPAEHSSIQSAVEASSDGDTILVAPGTYFENIKIVGKDIVLTSHFMYEKDAGFIANTILDGSAPILSDSASVVRITGTMDSTMILQGFTITGGKGTKWLTPGYPGQPATLGGGILVDSASPTIQYNLIKNNEALVSVSSLSAGGGGIRSGFGKPIIRNNMILDNKGLYGAGVVMNFPTGGTFTNNVIAGNVSGASFGGGAMWLGFGTNITIVNNTIVNNHSGFLSGGIEVIGGGLSVENCILWGNTGTNTAQITAGPTSVIYSDIQGGYDGVDNINVDPLLYGKYQYHMTGSPCIDLGNPQSPDFDDPENPSSPGAARWPSRGSLRNDMGAYGGPHAFSFERVFVYLKNNGVGSVPCTTVVEAYTTEPIGDLQWDFGDGTPDYNLFTTHDYNAWGVYPFSLKGDTGLGALSTLYTDSAYALADSMTLPEINAPIGQPVAVDIFGRNAPFLYNLIVPLAWSGSLELQFDSVTKTDTRTSGFGVLSYNAYDPGSGHISVRIQNVVSGSGPELVTGTGTLVRYWFTVPPTAVPGQIATLDLEGFSTYQPIFHSTLDYLGAPLEYRPGLDSGSITAVTCCYTRGDVNWDPLHKRNVVDIVFFANYMFQGGAAPACSESADVNDDSLLNVVDISLLAQYLFNGGVTPPVCP